MSAKPASMCRIALCGSGELRILRFCCSCILCKSFTELISIYIFINSFLKAYLPVRTSVKGQSL